MSIPIEAHRHFAAVIIHTPGRTQRFNYDRLCTAVRLVNELPWGIGLAHALREHYPQLSPTVATEYVLAAQLVVSAGIDLSALPD